MSDATAGVLRRLLPIILVLATAALGAALLGPLVQEGLDTGRTDPPPATALPPTATPAAAAPTSVAGVTPALGITPEPEITPVPVPTAAPERVIEIEASTALQFLDDRGRPVRAIELRAGERVRFRVDNTAGYDHSFFIGPFDRLQQGATQGLTGIPAWASGVQELSWVVPDDGAALAFGCTVPGHFVLMNGQLKVFGGS